MKRILAVTMALCAAAAAPVFAADVGVSVEISQPGVYGRIDVGRFPTPQVIVPQPVIVQPGVVGYPVQPIYLWVPPGHRKNWAKHCAEYRACGHPVYFVRHDWYNREVRGGREHRGEHRERGREERGRGDDRGHGDRGAGKGSGRGRD